MNILDRISLAAEDCGVVIRNQNEYECLNKSKTVKFVGVAKQIVESWRSILKVSINGTEVTVQ